MIKFLLTVRSRISGNLTQEQVLIPKIHVEFCTTVKIFTSKHLFAVQNQNCTLLSQLDIAENSSIGKKSFCSMTNFEVSL